MIALRRLARGPAGVVVAVLAAIAAVVAGARYVRAAGVSVPSMVLQTSTFVNTLEVRGEIRPLRSIVLTAPSSGSDLQIVNLVRNGANVAAGEVVVEFDTTPQQRTLEQRRSEWQQAQSEVAKAESEARRRVQAAEASLAELQSIAQRARLDLGRIELSSKVDGDKFKLAVADAEEKVRAQQGKLEGERRATAADVAIVRQKRDKAAFDVADARTHHRVAVDEEPGDGADLADAQLPQQRTRHAGRRRNSSAATGRGSARRSPSCRTCRRFA